MTDQERNRLRVLGNLYALHNTRFHNGDPHYRLPKSASKSDHSKEWGKETDKSGDKFAKFAKSLGLKPVFNGMYPSVELEGAEVPIYE
jgi:hypothetical protein